MKKTYSRAEKRAFYIGMGAGMGSAGDATAVRKIVQEKCGNTPEVMSSFERGLHMGKTERVSTPKKPQSFDPDEFYAATLRRSYQNK